MHLGAHCITVFFFFFCFVITCLWNNLTFSGIVHSYRKKNIIHNDGPSQMTAHIKTIMAHLIAGEKHKRLNAFFQNLFCGKTQCCSKCLPHAIILDEKEVKMTKCA